MLTIYSDPQFIAAEVAYRRERLTGGAGEVGASRGAGRRWTDRLHVSLRHRHVARARTA
jgi:hypothetical protein